MTDTGCLLATIDEEMGKIGPVPSGCGENPGSPAHGIYAMGWKSGHTSLLSSTVGPPQPSDSASSGPIFTSSATHQGSVSRP